MTIYRVLSAGGEPDNLTPMRIGERCDPAYSPFGLLYSLDGSDLYKVNPDGRSQRLTTDRLGNREPAWSANGMRIAFVSERDGNPEIYAMYADGSDPIQLTDRPGSDLSPTWSPKGNQLVFVAEEAGVGVLYISNVDGSEITRLTTGPGDNRSPAWSPDAQWIAYSSDKEGNREIYIISPDGAVEQRITDSAAMDDQPAWSPDSQWLVFISDREEAGITNLYAIMLGKTEPLAYFPQPENSIFAPAWADK
jgi:TolB protein